MCLHPLSQYTAEHLCPADKNQEAAHWEAALLVLPHPRRFQRTCGGAEERVRRKGEHLARSCNPKKGDRGKSEEPLTRPLHSINHNACASSEHCVININNEAGRWSQVPSHGKAYNCFIFDRTNSQPGNLHRSPQ